MVDIDEIYDAGFDRERFPGLLKKILAAMGAQSGLLGWFDLQNQARFEVEVGNDRTIAWPPAPLSPRPARSSPISGWTI
ncbi:hypothetical protein [Phenylobacterium sp. SCN 70-31]|uniref:hypothetical protein n=1 Tax=Phenylobacterium sp. SCN 70-31 TaxID=1660129 RepID=UPI00086A953F|nr:hypothetical protein [Phenylobacterium sp. SCN 70-31]ODT87549.1 MAG: hypothetical protein ABS78_11825 [Phenylobacterium sp. SCN 70-31]